MSSWMFHSIKIYIKTQYRKCFKLLPPVLKNRARLNKATFFRGGQFLILKIALKATGMAYLGSIADRK